MKKIILLFVLFFDVLAVNAQNDVTQFLGIPVDGSKSEMIRKIKSKGFRETSYDKEVLTGEFNGYPVNVYIVTNGNKVYRVMLCDANPVDERSILIRFNNLCNQFKSNSKYIPLDDYIISDDEDISYEMKVKNKRYEAVFLQKGQELSDTTLLKEKLQPYFETKYTPEQMANPTTEMMSEALTQLFGLFSKRPVWFIISEQYGKYYITMFYDNEYNRANGEDL